MADLKGVVSTPTPSELDGSSSSARRFREAGRIEVEERIVNATADEFVLPAMPSALSAPACGLLGRGRNFERGRNGVILFALPADPPWRLGSLAGVVATFLPLALAGVFSAGFAFLAEAGAAGGLGMGFFFEDTGMAVAVDFFCGFFVFDGVTGSFLGDFPVGTTNL